MLSGSIYRSVLGVALATLLLLALPLLASWSWTLSDFVVAGVLIFGTGLTFILVVRKASNIAYRAAVGGTLAAALLLIWINLAVGVIGSEDNVFNFMYIGVLTVGVVGAVIARLEAAGMARVLFVMALVQVLVTVIALIFGQGESLEIVGINGFFVAAFVGAALLFLYASRRRSLASAS